MSTVIVVGSGLSAAAACAVLKKEHDVIIFEQRSQLGGNCRDYKSQGTHVHQYGAHIYHNPNPGLHDWLSQFTEWVPYKHSVTALLPSGLQVPFPYSQETEAALGKVFTDDEIISAFFKGYSRKMWGAPWDELPASIRNRIPKRQDTSDFFPGQITALPARGYTHMLENMFDGCSVVLNAGPDDWEGYAKEAKSILYCGRLDLIRNPATGLRLGGECVNKEAIQYAWLDHVSLDFKWGIGDPVSPTAVLNYCSEGEPAIRRVQHAQLTGGNSKIFHLEYPLHSNDRLELTPTYPAPRTPRTEKALGHLKARAKTLYPHLHPLGRIAQHQYLDMHQAAGAGMALGLELL